MKRILVLILVMLSISGGAVFAKNVIPQISTANDVYIQKGSYYAVMQSAINDWLKISNYRIIANIGSSRTMSNIANIEFLFNSNAKDGLIQSGIKRNTGISYQRFNINTKNLSKGQLQAKCRHYAGAAFGVKESNNKASVMYKQPLDNQKILIEDINNFYSVQGIRGKIPNSVLKKSGSKK